MRRRFQWWLSDTAGQDLIEYALLAAFIAVAGIAGFNAISGAIGGTYTDSNTGVQNLWEVPPAP
jgi:Flp pilus assembly pilin Flp